MQVNKFLHYDLIHRFLQKADVLGLNSNHIVKKHPLSQFFLPCPLSALYSIFNSFIIHRSFHGFPFFRIWWSSNVKPLNSILLMEMFFFQGLRRTLLLTWQSKFPLSFFRLAFIFSLSTFSPTCHFMVYFHNNIANIIILVIYMVFYSFIKDFHFFDLFITFCFI